MTGPARPLPPLRVIEAALLEITESLAREVICPSAQAPRWNELEWRIAEATAVVQGISSLLASRLRWRGTQRWEAFLAEQKRHASLRHHRVEQLLALLSRAADQAGIAMVALKGSALYRLGIYRAGERPMGDIDLLVKPCDADAAARALSGLGYVEGLESERHRVFEPVQGAGGGRFGEHVDNPLAIELHTRIAEPLPVEIVDITSVSFPSDAEPGLRSYPSIAALMRHLLLHAATNMRARALRFIQLHDIAQLSGRMQESDWNELLRAASGARGLWWALAPLTLTTRYYPNVIPCTVVQAAAAGAPWLLRKAVRQHRLIDVSWSKVRIQAFPGIEWSKSFAEAIRFMMSRVFPSRRARQQLQAQAGKIYASVPWYGLSHCNRILRWVFSNPPRVQTMHAIKVAWESRP